MTENNDNAAAAAKNPPDATACNSCDHKKTGAAATTTTSEKRKTPLLPEPPKQTASTASLPASLKRQHSATVTATPSGSDPTSMITLTVAPFTGGPFSLKMRKTDSVEDLKKAVAKKLKVLKDRICLLYRER